MKKTVKSASLTTKATLFLFYIWPRPIQKLFAYILALFWFYILRMRVSLAKTQIKNVFPNMSKRDVSKTVFGSFYNLILILFEYSYFPFSTKKVFKYTELRNKEVYENLIAAGKPIFFMTGHMANGEMIVFRLCAEGVKLNLIGKRVGQKFIDSLLFEVRELSGLKHIPPKNGSIGIMEAVRKKEPVIFVHDQFRHPPRGVASDFLGLPTYTNSALAFFALKTDAAVIPVNMFRENGRIVADFSQPVPFEKKYDSEEKNIIHMTQVYNDVLEKYIRERPEGWMWVHKRWKQPNRK